MATDVSVSPAHPVNPNECQAHNHEYETQRRETRSLDFGSRVHRFLVSGDDADIEQPRKDEDQTGCSCCPSDAKDISNVGDEDD